MTVTANNSFTAGESVIFSGLNNGFTGLNGNTYTVLSAGLSSTKFEITSSVKGPRAQPELPVNRAPG